MKPLIFSALLLSAIGGASTHASAQVRVNVNLGTPIANETWYNDEADYYYLPEQQVYYNPGRKVYVWQDNNAWVYGNRLPDRYHGFNYRKSHYVKMHERAPFNRNDEYQKKYPRNWHGDNGHRH